jgi:hypothetical protein
LKGDKEKEKVNEEEKWGVKSTSRKDDDID